MTVLRLNRCKNCKLWRRARALGGGTYPRDKMACHLRLRTGLRNGERVLMPSLDLNDPPGPKYGKHTSPHDKCAYFVQKQLPYRRPQPVVIDGGAQAVLTDDVAESVQMANAD